MKEYTHFSYKLLLKCLDIALAEEITHKVGFAQTYGLLTSHFWSHSGIVCTFGVWWSHDSTYVCVTLPPQAPVSMKAVCQAAWLWTVAFGNLVVIIIAEGRLFGNQVNGVWFRVSMGFEVGGSLFWQDMYMSSVRLRDVVWGWYLLFRILYKALSIVSQSLKSS